jgi:hypothetical protein
MDVILKTKSILRERKLNEPKFHTTHKIQNGETYMFWAGITYMFKTCFLCKLCQWGVHYMHLHLKTLPYGHHSPETYKPFSFCALSQSTNTWVYCVISSLDIIVLSQGLMIE